jgi:hypothetical protein
LAQRSDERATKSSGSISQFCSERAQRITGAYVSTGSNSTQICTSAVVGCATRQVRPLRLGQPVMVVESGAAPAGYCFELDAANRLVGAGFGADLADRRGLVDLPARRRAR